MIDPAPDARQFAGMGQAQPDRPNEVLLHVGGAMLRLLPEGALWWPDAQTLIVSDLHLEKGASYAAGGQMLPPYDTSATLGAVERLVAHWSPARVISLGDSFHDRQSALRLGADDADRLRALTSSTDWVWVEGNHDPDPPAHLGGRAAKCFELSGINFRHVPSGAPSEISGHLHPCAKIGGGVRTLRRKCFISDGHRLVMPSLGAFTGGLNVLNPAFADAFPDGGTLVWALGAGQVFAVRQRRLVPDGPRKGSAWKLKPAGFR